MWGELAATGRTGRMAQEYRARRTAVHGDARALAESYREVLYLAQVRGDSPRELWCRCRHEGGVSWARFSAAQSRSRVRTGMWAAASPAVSRNCRTKYAPSVAGTICSTRFTTLMQLSISPGRCSRSGVTPTSRQTSKQSAEP